MLACFVPCASATMEEPKALLLLMSLLEVSSSFTFAFNTSAITLSTVLPNNISVAISNCSSTLKMSTASGLVYHVTPQSQFENKTTTDVTFKPAAIALIYIGIVGLIVGTMLLIILEYALKKSRRGFYDVQRAQYTRAFGISKPLVTVVILCFINGVSAEQCPPTNMIPVFAAFTFVGMAIGFLLCGCVNLCKATENPVETVIITPRSRRETPPPPYPGTGPGTRSAPSIWTIAVLGLFFISTTEALETPKIILKNPICNAYPTPTRTYCSISVYRKFYSGMLQYTNLKHQTVVDHVHNVISVPFNSTFSCFNATNRYEYKVKNVCDPGKNYVIPVFLGLALGFMGSIVMLFTGDADSNAQFMDIEARRHPDGLFPNKMFMVLVILAVSCPVQSAYIKKDLFITPTYINVLEGANATLSVPYVPIPYVMRWSDQYGVILYEKIHQTVTTPIIDSKYSLLQDSLVIKNVSRTDDHHIFTLYRQYRYSFDESTFSFVLNVTSASKINTPKTIYRPISNIICDVKQPCFFSLDNYNITENTVFVFENPSGQSIIYWSNCDLTFPYTSIFSFEKKSKLFTINHFISNYSGLYLLYIHDFDSNTEFYHYYNISTYKYIKPILLTQTTTQIKQTTPQPLQEFYIWLICSLSISAFLILLGIIQHFYLKRTSAPLNNFESSGYKSLPKNLLLIAFLSCVQPGYALPPWFNDNNVPLVTSLSILLALLIMANILIVILLIIRFLNQYRYRVLYAEDLEAQKSPKMTSGKSLSKQFLVITILCLTLPTVHCAPVFSHLFNSQNDYEFNNSLSISRQRRSFIGEFHKPLIQTDSAIYWSEQVINASVGDTIFLVVKSSVSDTYSWWRDNITYKINTNTTEFTVYSNHSIVIHANSYNLSGTYSYYETSSIPIKTFRITVAETFFRTFFLGFSGLLKIPFHDNEIVSSSWFKNGNKIPSSELKDVLIFENVIKETEGEYEVFVNITTKPVTFKFIFSVSVTPVQTYYIDYYAPFTFNFNIQTGPKYEWLLGYTEESFSVPYYSNPNFMIYKNGTISFPLCKSIQTGAYELVAELNNTYYILAGFELQVRIPVTGIENRTTILHLPDGIPDADWWDFNEQNLTSNNKHYIKDTRLIIRHTNFSDDGLYTAHFKGHENENILFNLTIVKCNNTDREDSFVGTEGHSICLPGCIETNASYSWFKGDSLIAIDGTTQSSRLYALDGTLCIHHLYANDSGTYFFVKTLNQQKHILRYNLQILTITSYTYVNCTIGNECNILLNPSLIDATFVEVWHLSNTSTEYDDLITLYDKETGTYENSTADGYFFNLTNLYIYELNHSCSFDIIVFAGTENDYDESNVEKTNIYRYVIANQTLPILPLTTPAPSNWLKRGLNLVRGFTNL